MLGGKISQTVGELAASFITQALSGVQSSSLHPDSDLRRAQSESDANFTLRYVLSMLV